MTVTEIRDLAQFNQVINSGKVVVIDFWATWCGPCRQISPIFEKLQQGGQFSGVEFYKVDVDTVPDVSKEVGIRAMPTFLAFKDGDKIDELVGANPPALQALLQKLNS